MTTYVIIICDHIVVVVSCDHTVVVVICDHIIVVTQFKDHISCGRTL